MWRLFCPYLLLISPSFGASGELYFVISWVSSLIFSYLSSELIQQYKVKVIHSAVPSTIITLDIYIIHPSNIPSIHPFVLYFAVPVVRIAIDMAVYLHSSTAYLPSEQFKPLNPGKHP